MDQAGSFWALRRTIGENGYQAENSSPVEKRRDRPIKGMEKASGQSD